MGYRNSKRYSYKRKLRRNRYRLSNETTIERILSNPITVSVVAGLIIEILKFLL